MPELAVIGWPLDKTFSPLMQNAALKSVGLLWKYEAIPVPPEYLKEFFSKASEEMRGFNVTMPHKRLVYELCTEKDNFARISGAVNTVVFKRKGKKIESFGYNTDGPGLLKSLREKAKAKRIDSALFLGAGGAAAGGIAALLTSGTKRIYIANRTLKKAKELAENFRKKFDGAEFKVIALEKVEICDALKEVELIVNCIPEEKAADFEEIFEKRDAPGKIFCDFSYGEKPGRLYSKAKELGFVTVSGVEILLWQGAYAFEIFTERECPVDSMKKALVEKVGSWWLEC
ncbi:MAG: shikimate dehydrogenase [Tepidanaerobacteraceae bacterium]|nr:shikimate dehydrogenase [Tepidanaerobacteraceae bacterium]